MANNVNPILGLFLCFLVYGQTSAGPSGLASYFKSTPETPLECACDAAITKIVIQEINRTVMVPEFVPYDKHFARVTKAPVMVPFFTDSMEEVLEAGEYTEKMVPIVNVDYKWMDVKKRMPVYNRTTLQIDEYTLQPVEYVHQDVKMEEIVSVETTIQEMEEEIEETTVEMKENIVKYETIEYEDFKMEVEEVFYQDVVEYVEQVEYKPREVYVWQIEMYDEEIIQKEVIPMGGAAGAPVEIDQITIERKAVQIPRIKFTPREVLIHDPLEIVQTPVPDPEFFNQTYKVPKIQMRTIPVPQYKDTPVQVPTYKRVPCSLPRDPVSSFVPSNCSCTPCQACTVCPVSHVSQTDIDSTAIQGGYSSGPAPTAAPVTAAPYVPPVTTAPVPVTAAPYVPPVTAAAAIPAAVPASPYYSSSSADSSSSYAGAGSAVGSGSAGGYSYPNAGGFKYKRNSHPVAARNYWEPHLTEAHPAESRRIEYFFYSK